MGRHPALVPVAHLTLLRYCSMRPLGRLLPPRREGEEVAGGTPPGPRQGSAPAPPRRTGSEPPAGECPCTPGAEGREQAPGRRAPLHPRGEAGEPAPSPPAGESSCTGGETTGKPLNPPRRRGLCWLQPVLVDVHVYFVARHRVFLPHVALAEADQVERPRRQAVLAVG